MRNKIITSIVVIVIAIAVLKINMDNINHGFIVLGTSSTNEYNDVSLDGRLISLPFKKQIISEKLN